MIYLALADNGMVLAHFARREDCAKYCAQIDACEVAFNLFNHNLEAAPLVGTIYTA